MASSVTFTVGGQSATVNILASLASGGGGGGIQVTPGQLQAAVAGNPAGTRFLVSPGTANNVALVLKSGQIVEALDPANPPVFVGPNSPTNTMKFAVGAGGLATDVVLRNLRITGYHPADPSWRNVEGNTGGFARVPTIDGNSLVDCLLDGLEMYENGMAVKLGDGMILNNVNLHHNHYFGLKGNDDSFWQVLGGEWAFNNVHPLGGGYYNDNTGAANKFVGGTDGLIDGLWAHHNQGPGVWFDSGSTRVTGRNLLCEDNTDAGWFWEINNGYCTVEDSTFRRNGGAANLFIANSRGTATNPIMLRRNNTSAHTAGRETRLLGNGNRSPLLGYVSVLNNITPSIVVALTNGHPQPEGIVASGNVNAAGNPVGIS